MKVAYTTVFLLVCYLGNTQTNQRQPATDTVPRADTALIDIKRDAQENLPTLLLVEDDLEEGASSGVSSILSAGRNPFLSAAAFNFSPVRFRLRGYESYGDAFYINGISFSNLDNGFIPYGLWGGLNNAMRMQEVSYGLEPNDFAMGTIGLNTNVDLRAGNQRVQTQVGYALSNRNYRHRVSFSHGSGFNKKGWAYSLAFAARYANEGYVPGTYYRGFSYYMAADKKLDNKNTISLIAFGAPTENGRQSASVQEAMDLAGTHYYNPSWGYQNGEKRNANISETLQPAFIAVHEYKPHNKSRWMTSLAYVFGDRKLSGFDWYNAPDPRPDYYRYLPSYYEWDNPEQTEALRNLMKQNLNLLQVNWPRFYEVNKGNMVTVRNVNGETGNDIFGNRSLYILSNRVINLNRFIFNSTYHSQVNSHMLVTTGVHYQKQINHYYQQVKDLLGGDFWVNVNQFAERDFPNDPNSMQYDMDHPNQIKKAGDQYGYNYKMTVSKAGAWLQAVMKLTRFDFFAAASVTASSFYRTGLNRNGLFPEASLGNSRKSKFFNPGAKAGLTYKKDGRNYFFLNAAYQANPPYFDNVFIAQRTRNTVPENLKSETVISTEGGYKLQAPKLKIGLTGFYSKTRDGYDLMTFYHDQYQNFVNYALSGIDKVFFGGELGIEYKINSTLSFNGAAAVGRYYYDSRQHAVVTVDNSARVITEQTIYLKNFRIPSTPQNAYSAGFFYRSPKYWYLSITSNYFSNMWLSVNPLRRTSEAIGEVDTELPETNELIQRMTEQERFKDQFTLDLFGGWSKKLPRRLSVNKKPTYLVFTIGVNNILNNTTIRSGGYEQLRFDYETKNVQKFPPKYYYAYGLNYFGSVTLRF